MNAFTCNRFLLNNQAKSNIEDITDTASVWSTSDPQALDLTLGGGWGGGRLRDREQPYYIYHSGGLQAATGA